MSELKNELVKFLKSDLTHVVIFAIFNMAYDLKRRKSFIDGNEYSVSIPNPNFRAEDAIPILTDLTQQIHQHCPQARIFIMIPAMPDLQFYNERHILNAPADIQQWYQELPRTGERELYLDTLHAYKELKRLHQKRYNLNWPYKDTISITDCINHIPYKKLPNVSNPYRLRVKREDPKNGLYTLREKGWFNDGIHPSIPLLDSIWECFRKYHTFDVDQSPSSLQVVNQVNEPSQNGSSVRTRIFYSSKKRSALQSISSNEDINEPSTSTGVTEKNRHTKIVFDLDDTNSMSKSQNIPIKLRLSKTQPVVTLPGLQRALNQYSLDSASNKTPNLKRTMSQYSLDSPWKKIKLHRDPISLCNSLFNSQQLKNFQEKFNELVTYMLGHAHARDTNVNIEDLEPIIQYLLEQCKLKK